MNWVITWLTLTLFFSSTFGLGEDLIAHYTFEEDPKNLVLNDQSTNYYHASYKDKSAIVSRGRALKGEIFNRAIQFTSYDAQSEPLIVFPQMTLLRNELTVSFLFETRDTSNQAVFSLNFQNGKSISATLRQDFMYLNFFDEKTVDLDFNFESRALYHLVFTMNSNSMNFYVNSILIQTIFADRDYDFGPNFNIRLGYNNSQSYCTSVFDELTLWNNALDYLGIYDLFQQVAFGVIPTCNNKTLVDGPLFDTCDEILNNSGKTQVGPCQWGSPYKSTGVTCNKDLTYEFKMTGPSDPYAFRFLSNPKDSSYISFSFRFLDLCRTQDPNEDMEDFTGSCRRYGKYMVIGLCAFNNYCINLGISTYGQRFFHHEGYVIGDLSEFGKITRPMYQEYPNGPLVVVEVYQDRTLWVYFGKDERSLIGHIQGYRLNLPFSLEYFNLLRVFTTSSTGEVGAIFSNFTYQSENFFSIPEGCPERMFFNGYDCQECAPNSYSYFGSVGADSCICEYGYFADNCRSSPLCSGNKPSFSFNKMDSSYLQFSGSAKLSSTGIGIITPSSSDQSGSIFFNQPWSLVDFSSNSFPEVSFSSHFIFIISNNAGNYLASSPGADGFAFIMSSSIPTNLPKGGAMGYKDLKNSIAIEFDTFLNREYKDISDNHVGLNINGNLISTVQANIPVSLKNGGIWHCWVYYDSTYGVLTVKVNDTNVEPKDPLIKYSIEVEKVIGNPEMYIGFTGATGGQFSAHQIVKWDFEMIPQLSCSPCGKDAYKSFRGDEKCIACPPGSTTFDLTGAADVMECQCYPGLFMNDFFTCQECPVNTTSSYGQTECTPCGPKSSTLGLKGQSMCSCDDGYYMDFDMTCKDYNECFEQNTCMNGGTCINLDGSFSCKCKQGFRGDKCEIDINECLNDPCWNGGTCVNVPGSFECVCPPGWNGYLCLYDIDECQIPNICHTKATCYNTPGSYYCTCNVGLVGNGKECNEIKGPSLLSPKTEDIFARFLKLSWVPEQYFNVTSYSLEIDYTEQLGSPFSVDEKRTFISERNEVIIDKLPPYQNMMLRLRAISNSVVSPPSNIINIRTLATSPDPPVLSIREQVDGFSLLIKWIAGRPNGATVTSFKVMWSEDDAFNTVVTETVPVEQTWLEVTSLIPGRNYTFSVIAISKDFGDSSPSEAIVASVSGQVKPTSGPTDTPTSVPIKKGNGGLIAGIIIGVLIFIVIIVAGVFYYKKNRMQGRIKLPERPKPSIGLLNPIDDSLNVPDAFSEEDEEDAIEK